MASTYSTRLRFELIGNGDQDGAWGTTTNTNLGTLIEEAIAGVASVSIADADTTLTANNGSSDQARRAVLSCTGALTTTRNVIVPTQTKLYVVFNGTSGGQSIIVKTSGGSGITVPNGKKKLVYCDGTNVVDMVTDLPSGTTINNGAIYSAGGTDVALADGGTGASLADPNADRILFWDDSAGAITWLEVGSGLSISATTLSATGSTSGFLTASNNLSDLANASTARTNLGLGTAALAAIGTSGDTVPKNNTENVFSANQRISTSDGSVLFLVNGGTKGVRWRIGSTISIIEGVDSTGIGSFEPLGIGGSTVQIQISGNPLGEFDSSGLKVPVAVSSETSGTLTNASANKHLALTGNITLNNSVFATNDKMVFDPGSSSRTITRGSGVTMYVNGTDSATATIAANQMAGAHWRSASVVVLTGAVS